MTRTDDRALLDIGVCSLDPVTMNQALKRVKELSRGDRARYVVTPNIDHVARLSQQPEGPSFRSLYDEAALCLCDSRILEKVLRIAGKRIPEVIPGSTLTQRIFDEQITPQDRVLVLGGSEQTFVRLLEAYPQFTMFHRNPSMGFIHNDYEVKALTQLVERTRPTYTFLALGSPQQERLAHRIMTMGGATGVCLCIGSSLRFIVGEETRAPRAWQALHLEWLYRLLQDPFRLGGRYLANAFSLPGIYRAVSGARMRA